MTEFKAFFARAEWRAIRKRMRRGLMQTIESGGLHAQCPLRLPAVPPGQAALAGDSRGGGGIRALYLPAVSGRGRRAEHRPPAQRHGQFAPPGRAVEPQLRPPHTQQPHLRRQGGLEPRQALPPRRTRARQAPCGLHAGVRVAAGGRCARAHHPLRAVGGGAAAPAGALRAAAPQRGRGQPPGGAHSLRPLRPEDAEVRRVPALPHGRLLRRGQVHLHSRGPVLRAGALRTPAAPPPTRRGRPALAPLRRRGAGARARQGGGPSAPALRVPGGRHLRPPHLPSPAWRARRENSPLCGSAWTRPAAASRSPPPPPPMSPRPATCASWASASPPPSRTPS